MNLSTEDYAWLAKDAYVNERKSEVDGNPVTINDHKYKVFAYAANASGFHATAYKQVEPPHGIIIAYRGTDPGHALTTVQDAAVDAIMVTSKINPQLRDADRFTEQVLEKAKMQGVSPASITVAGHSLGGTLAQVEACRHQLHGQTFNAFGAAELGLGIPAGGNQVINNVLAGDPVSAAGQQFGMVRVYATTADVAQLQQAGYLDGRHGFVPALQGMRLGDHSIDNFAPDPGRGLSVLTADNEARANTNALSIATFRHDVHAAREGIHLATQPGMPLFGLQATAWEVEGITTAGVTTSRALEKAGDALEHEVTRGARFVAHGAQAVAREIEQAYDTTRDHVVEGAQAAERVVHRSYDATRQGFAQGIHATERVMNEGVRATERAAHAAAGRAAGAYDTLTHPGSWFGGAPASPTTPARLDHPTHPDHALYQQARSGVHQLDTGMHRAPDQRSENLAAALAVAAHRQGLTRIDQVALSDDGTRAFALQRGSTTQIAHVQTAAAVHISIAQSSAALAQAAQQRSDAGVSAPQESMPQQAVGR
jgi:hypothetical protein